MDLADRRRLVVLLRTLPALETEQSRRQLLAGLGEPGGGIDVSGSSAEAVSRIVHHLTGYGRVPGGPHALGLFLNLVKGFAGPEHQDYLADVLTRYDLMTPVARVPGIAWRGTTADLTEKIVRANTWRSVAFLGAAVEAAGCVAYVATESWSGTGFLVGPDLLLTGNHVLPSRDLVPHTTFRFGEQHDDYGGLAAGLFHTNADLDYTLVQLDGSPGDHLPLGAETVAVGDSVNVIQHPGGRPKQITMGDNVVEYVGGSVVQYVTSTLPGSSGAPVLTGEWRVCAVHRAAGSVTETGTSRTFFANEGIMIAAILRDLPASVRAALPIGGVVPG